MGCGKSKHAVETANTVVKSTNSDCTKETSTTKTITEKGDAVIQKEVETKSVFVQDTKRETAKTKIDPSDVTYKTHNVAPKSAENIEKATELFKEEEKIKDSNPTDVGNANNVTPSSTENTGKSIEVIEEDEKVKDLNPTAARDANTNNMIAPLSKDDVGTPKVLKKDEEKVGSTLIADNETKTEKVPPTEEGETKESKLTKDNMTKTEFMTPTLSEDVVGPFEVVKENEEVRDSKEDNVESEITNEKFVKTINNSSNTKDDNLKVKEQKVVAPAVESTKVETKKGMKLSFLFVCHNIN